MTLVDLYELLLECASPVAALHSLGIIHRDVKPSNFIFSATSSSNSNGNGCRVKLIDFGIACCTDDVLPPADLCVGSPAFCAPEVAASFLNTANPAAREQVTPAVDVYSLGVVFYVMLEGCSGTAPYQDEHRPLDKKAAPAGEKPTRELEPTQRTVRTLQRARDGEWYWSAKFRQRISLLEAKKKQLQIRNNFSSSSSTTTTPNSQNGGGGAETSNNVLFPNVTLIDMKHLIEAMMVKDPAKRLSASEVCARLSKMIAMEEQANEQYIRQQALMLER